MDVESLGKGALRAVGQPAATPSARKTVESLLDEARSGLSRLGPDEAHAAVADGALLIDIRSELQGAADGVVPGAIGVPRNVLEWRCDPSCPAHDVRIDGLDRHLIVMCDQGYQSSLAAATLQQLGFHRATDLIGGFQAWRAAGLTVHHLTRETPCELANAPAAHHLEGADANEVPVAAGG